MSAVGTRNPLMSGGNAPGASASDLEAIQKLGAARKKLKEEIAKVIIGQEHIVDDLLTALFARGHCLMIGVPGLAKTLMVRTISRAIDLEFNRIQFTPDLMPSDITGTEMIEDDKVSGTRAFRFIKGPVFANILLADEINRTPPKTQAAMLQAMQELQVTVSGKTYDLPKPFFVLATQNPIEQEGTYPLPEAQLDRFMFDIRIGYPKPHEELAIAKSTTSDSDATVTKVLNGRGDHATPVDRPQAADQRPRRHVRGEPRAGQSARGRERAGVHQGIRQLGRGHSRRAIPGAGREGSRRHRRGIQCDLRPRSRGRPAGAAAPRHAELPRRGRRVHGGQAGEAAAGACEGAAGGRLQIGKQLTTEAQRHREKTGRVNRGENMDERIR